MHNNLLINIFKQFIPLLILSILNGRHFEFPAKMADWPTWSTSSSVIFLAFIQTSLSVQKHEKVRIQFKKIKKLGTAIRIFFLVFWWFFQKRGRCGTSFNAHKQAKKDSKCLKKTGNCDENIFLEILWKRGTCSLINCIIICWYLPFIPLLILPLLNENFFTFYSNCLKKMCTEKRKMIEKRDIRK